MRKGYTSPGIDFSANADKPLRANMHYLQTRFPYILIVPQAVTEDLLEHHLESLGVKVERGRSMTGFTESGSGIRATIEEQAGGSFEIEARYLLGADGPHSTTRHALGIPFEGSSYGWTAFLGDCTIEGHHAEGGTEQHSNDRGLAFIVPFDDGSHRIVTIDEKYQGGEKRSDLTLEELQESISAILEKPVKLSHPKWLTRWGTSLRLAPKYRSGRAFIAGDAAHTHSPAGGQGMNTGIQDAFNLGWKLALVANGTAPEALLESFEKERQPIGQTILRTSDILLRSLRLQQPFLRKLREILFLIFIPLPAVQKKLASNLSGLGVRYKTGEGELAGARIPDLELMTAGHDIMRLYELLRFPGYTLLLFIDPKEAQSAKAEIERIARLADDRLQVFVILDNGLPELHDFAPAQTLVDYRGDFTTRIGERTGRVLLVRPDAYGAFDLDGLDSAAVTARLGKWKLAKQA